MILSKTKNLPFQAFASPWSPMDKNANNPEIWIWNRAFVLMEMSDKTDLLNITASVCFVPLSRLQVLETVWMSDVYSVLSSALLSSCRYMPVLLLWNHSIAYLAFLFSYCLLFFPAFLSFPKNAAFSRCAWSGTASVLLFLPPAIFQAEFI